jgi:hypothetical protein
MSNDYNDYNDYNDNYDINVHNIIETKLKKHVEILNMLHEKYKNDDYMLKRLDININALVYVLNDNDRQHNSNIDRIQLLINKQTIFIEKYLSENVYFYTQHNNCFYEYKNNHYNQMHYDDVIYKILSALRREPIVKFWKYKTQKKILTQIKKKHLYNSIPSVITQESIIKTIVPSLFNTKNNAKYFLTIIGDIIQKKIINEKFLISKKTKQIIYNLSNILFNTIGVTTINKYFVSKYHINHGFNNYRLFTNGTNDNIGQKINYNTLNVIDFICVSCYYSNLYNNSDNYVMNHSNNDFKKYTLYLKNKTPNKLINSFCKKYFIINDNVIENNTNDEDATNNIKWSCMYKLWKEYLNSLKMSNIIYSDYLKITLSNILNYDKNTDTFLNISYTPFYLSKIKNKN